MVFTSVRGVGGVGNEPVRHRETFTGTHEGSAGNVRKVRTTASHLVSGPYEGQRTFPGTAGPTRYGRPTDIGRPPAGMSGSLGSTVGHKESEISVVPKTLWTVSSLLRLRYDISTQTRLRLIIKSLFGTYVQTG